MGENKKLKIAFFISDSGERDRQRLYEFQVEALEEHLQYYYILSGNLHFQSYLRSKNIGFKVLDYNPKRLVSIVKFAYSLRGELSKYDIVHTHYHDANFLGLLAAKLAGVPIRVYTRHHNSYYHDTSANKSIFINKIFNTIATKVIAPSRSVFDTLAQKEGVNEKKLEIVHHPIVIDNSETVNLKKKYNLPSTSFVVGTIATFQPLKGISFIIKAFEQILIKHPNAVLVMANAHGSHYEEYSKLALEILGPDRIRMIKYENDVTGLYNMFDVFIHAPISASSEAFGQVYIEAMAFGVPSVFTNSGVLPEISKDGWNCLVVPYSNSIAIVEAVEKYLSDDQLKEQVVSNAAETVKSYFSPSLFRRNLINAYSA